MRRQMPANSVSAAYRASESAIEGTAQARRGLLDQGQLV